MPSKENLALNTTKGKYTLAEQMQRNDIPGYPAKVPGNVIRRVTVANHQE